MQEEIVIKVDNVSKNFRLPHEKVSSLKSIFAHFLSYLRHRRRFEVQHALRDISFEIKKGEFFGIVGRNGSGKSTLLKILAGIYQPNKGTVKVEGRLVPFIELGVGFNGELTGRENVYLNGALLGFSKEEVDGQYDDIVAFAELEKFMDQKLKNYSSGMQVRLAFSLAIRAQADILLVDEVLAVGDADFQRKCFEFFKKLKKDKKTVVFVSHDMNSVKEFCDRAILIEDSELLQTGKAAKIAREYSLMFMKESQKDQGANIQENRWGNGDLKISGVTAAVLNDKVIIDVKAKAHKAVDRAIYGLHILAQDGVEITAMNNRMIQAPDLADLKAGSSVSIKWEVLNIFNDGKYFITLTLVTDVYETLDWFVEAANFTVKRMDRSTTAVLPPIDVAYTILPRNT